MRINLSGRPGKIAFFYYILPVLRGLLVVTFFFLGMLRTFEESINLRSTGALPPIHPITHLLTFSDVLQIILGLVIIGLVYSKKLPKIMAIYPVYFIIWQMLLIFVFPKAITNYCFSVSFANYPVSIFEACFNRIIHFADKVLLGAQLIDIIVPSIILYKFFYRHPRRKEQIRHG